LVVDGVVYLLANTLKTYTYRPVHSYESVACAAKKIAC